MARCGVLLALVAAAGCGKTTQDPNASAGSAGNVAEGGAGASAGAGGYGRGGSVSAGAGGTAVGGLGGSCAAPDAAELCEARRPASSVQLLSRDAHDRALDALLGAGPRAPRLGNGAVITEAAFDDIVSAVALRADTTDVEPWSECSSSVPSECAAEFVADVGARAYRRALTSEEIASYVNLYEQTGDFRELLKAIALSPYFVFEIALGSAACGAGSWLTADEYATRAALFLWGQPADTALRARTAELGAPPIDEMLKDPRFSKEGAHTLAERWLGLDALYGLAARDGEPSAELALDMLTETRHFVGEVLGSSAALAELLGADHTYLRPALATHYGLAEPAALADAVVRVELPAEERAGLLTQASVLTLHPTVTQRGAWVQQVFRCAPVPAHPEFLMVESREDAPPAWYEMQMTDPVCRACHALLHPAGFALTAYDGLGRYRVRHADGTPVNATTTLWDGFSVISGADGLSTHLAGRTEVVECITRSWFDIAVGRADDALVTAREVARAPVAPPIPVDRCAVGASVTASDLRSVLRWVVSSPEFRWAPPSRPKGALLASSNAWEHALVEVESLMVAVELQGAARERLDAYAAVLSRQRSAL